LSAWEFGYEPHIRPHRGGEEGWDAPHDEGDSAVGGRADDHVVEPVPDAANPVGHKFGELLKSRTIIWLQLSIIGNLYILQSIKKNVV
jgi:hypothetical protein